MVGETAEHGLADRVGVDQLVALVEVADLDAAGHRHPARVGLLEAGHHLEQGGLAVAVATDDADPLPRRDAEGDLVEQRADAVRLGDPLQVDQVGCDAHPVLTLICSTSSDVLLVPRLIRSRRPGRRGPARRRRARPRGRGRAAPPASACAAVGDSARNRQVGPEPETSPRTAPSDSPRSSRSPRSGRRSSAGSWRSLCSAAPSRCGSGSPAPPAARRRAPARRPHRGTSRRSAGRPPASTARRRRTVRRPTTTARCRRIGVTSSPRPVPSAVPPMRAKGTSLPSSAASREQLVVGRAGVPQPVQGEQGRGGVGGAAGHPPGDRDLLVDQEVGHRVPAGTGRHQRGGAGDDVVLADRDAGDVDVRRAVGHHAERRPLGGDELVVQARSPGRRSPAGGSRPRGRHPRRGGG